MDIVSFIAGAVGGMWAVYMFHRKIQVENILQERTKWRERIRDLSRNIAKENPNPEAIAELEIRLNPLDEYDRAIIRDAKSLLDSQDRKEAFLEQIARLLKYDWERAKNETGLLGFFTVIDEKVIRQYDRENNHNRQDNSESESKFKHLNRNRIVICSILLFIILAPCILKGICVCWHILKSV